MDIVIIGTGNTATIIGRALLDAGHTIIQVYGRNSMAASELAYNLGTESTNYWNVVNRNADLYILAVSDIALEEVTAELQLSKGILVHTAASVSKNILRKSASRYGVFYPLQSLSRENSSIPEIPILIDAGDPATLEVLRTLATSISSEVIVAGDEERLKTHLAAVICNNFVNHLYHLAYIYCREEGLSFNSLLPLIKGTAEKLETMDPARAQTGPAIRGDKETIEKHLRLLEKNEVLQRLYRQFTDSIQRLKGSI